MKKELKKVGRPEEYSIDACEAIIKAASKGKRIAGMILAAGCKSRQTFYNWQNAHPEFKEACILAQLVSQEYYEEQGRKGMEGEVKNYSASTYAIIMNNCFSEDYNKMSQSTQSSTTNISFSQTNNNLNLSNIEMKERVESLLDKLKSVGIEFNKENSSDWGEIIDAE